MLKTLLVCWVASLSLGQFSAFYKGAFGGVYLFDFMALVFVAVGILYFLVAKNTVFSFPRGFLWGFGYIVIAIISLVIAFSHFSLLDLGYASFYLIRFSLYFLGGLVIYNCLSNKLFGSDFLALLVAYSAVFVVIAGFLQLLFLPDFTVLDPLLGWDPHKGRLASTFFDPNFAGAYLVLCLNIILGTRHRFGKFFPFLAGFILLAIFLTFSRSAWLMLAISSFVWGCQKYKFLLLLAFILAFGAYFAVPRVQTRLTGITDPADSAHFRIISWSNTLNIAKANPLWGVGFNTFRFAQKEYGYFGLDWGGHSGGGSDSSFLLVIATTGILGLILFLGYFFSPARTALKADRAGYWKLPVLSCLSSLFVGSFFINSVFYPQILFLLNLIIGVSIFSYKQH